MDQVGSSQHSTCATKRSLHCWSTWMREDSSAACGYSQTCLGGLQSSRGLPNGSTGGCLQSIIGTAAQCHCSDFAQRFCPLGSTWNLHATRLLLSFLHADDALLHCMPSQTCNRSLSAAPPSLSCACLAGGTLHDFDFLVFDEISQIGWIIWSRIAAAVSEMHASPVVALLGDFQQLQPLDGAPLRAALLHEIALGTSRTQLRSCLLAC